MTKPKTSADLARSLDATLTDLIVEARAVDWDFVNRCYVSGHDASNPDARLLFECLLTYAKREGGWPLGTQQRLVMEFALETTSRRGEVVRLGPQHVRNGHIRIERIHGSEDVAALRRLATRTARAEAALRGPSAGSRAGRARSPGCADRRGFTEAAGALFRPRKTGSQCHNGSEEQMFGAKRRVPGAGRCD